MNERREITDMDMLFEAYIVLEQAYRRTQIACENISAVGGMELTEACLKVAGKDIYGALHELYAIVYEEEEE